MCCLFWIYLCYAPEWSCILHPFSLVFLPEFGRYFFFACLLFSIYKCMRFCNFFPLHISIGTFDLSVYVRIGEGRNNILLIIIIITSSSVECCSIIRFRFLFCHFLFLLLWTMCVCVCAISHVLLHLEQFFISCLLTLLCNIKRMMQTFCVSEIAIASSEKNNKDFVSFKQEAFHVIVLLT